MAATLERLRTKTHRESVPRVHRWTRQEFYSLCDLGWFANQRVNLLKGRIVVMPPPGPDHEYTVDGLIEYLQSIVPATHYVRSEKAFAASDDSDPMPDTAVVPGTRHDYVKAYPTKAEFVAEVSKSTLRVDIGLKAAIYAQSRVPEYWVLDLVHRRLIVHRDPVSDSSQTPAHRYKSVQAFEAHEQVAPLFAPANVVSVESLLPPTA